MNRVWDYIGFAVCFGGLGYIVLWFLGSPAYLSLPPALHVLGMASAMFVPVYALLHVLRRRGEIAATAVLPRKPMAVLRPARHKPVQPMPYVKPRNHFGLRGTPD